MGELMNVNHDIVQHAQPMTLSVAEVKSRMKALHQLLDEVLVEGVDADYGIIPGIKKKTLFKPGAEKIAVMFMLSPHYEHEDLSTATEARYSVRCALTGPDGTFRGDARAEWSSAETNNAWRKANSDEEFDDTNEDERRIVHKKAQGGGTYEVKQVRVSKADSAIKGLAMAEKRAFVRAVRTATGASAIFTSDIEDLPSGMVNSGRESKPPISRPQSRKQETSCEVDETSVENVTTQTGNKKDGTQWTKYFVIGTNGDKYSTFSESHGKLAMSSKGTGEIVRIEYKTGQYGKELLNISPMESPTTREPGAEG